METSEFKNLQNEIDLSKKLLPELDTTGRMDSFECAQFRAGIALAEKALEDSRTQHRAAHAALKKIQDKLKK